ncbi:hypothetical protein AOXY_G33522 [Acipenser oxyrinchus oxyrinchus]|uniref:Uncharacterized protein n=1 Tax=Acipenser oxyrinchus oxyrinchus TaxID=40147 RepID=A0AAD8CG65_ACIOX|nr:hypothetical protein AOXY_G33522 [Acipenser oxyrinchus oxyrinchus]
MRREITENPQNIWNGFYIYIYIYIYIYGKTNPRTLTCFFWLSSQHFPAMSGAFMDSPYNGNTSLQTSTSNLHVNTRPQEPEEESKFSSEAIWLWIAIIATIGNVVVVAVVCVCTF